MSAAVDRILREVKQQSVRQDSLTNQLDDLYAIAVKFGLYDAADFIKVAYRV